MTLAQRGRCPAELEHLIEIVGNLHAPNAGEPVQLTCREIEPVTRAFPGELGRSLIGPAGERAQDGDLGTVIVRFARLHDGSHRWDERFLDPLRDTTEVSALVVGSDGE